MSAAQFCSARLTAQPYVNLTTHSAHMSERPEVSEKGQGRVLKRAFKRKKGKKTDRWRNEAGKEETCARCTHLFTCMHSRGPIVQSIIKVLSTPTEKTPQKPTVTGSCGISR